MTAVIRTDMPESEYHAHPALSNSTAKILLDSPAKYQYRLTHPQETKDAFDVGHAFHARVLGVGDPIERLDFDNRMTKAYKEAAIAARLAGHTPLLAKDDDQVLRMVEAFEAHPSARFWFSNGAPEVSIFWEDDLGTPWRARLDWLRTDCLVADLKSAVDASRFGFGKAVYNFRYHLQDAVYKDAAKSLTGAEHDMIFAAVEKEAPHLVALYDLDEEAKELGRNEMRRASLLWQQCTESGEWPGYPSEITTLSLPRWARSSEEMTA